MDDDEEEDDDNGGLENNPWTERLKQKKTAQRKKKQSTLPQKKPNFTTVLYIEAKGSKGKTPLECVRNTIAIVMTELSGRGKLKGIQLMTNNPIGGGHKSIISASAVPLKWISENELRDLPQRHGRSHQRNTGEQAANLQTYHHHRV